MSWNGAGAWAQTTMDEMNSPVHNQPVELSNGSIFQLEAKPIAKSIDGKMVHMYSYNGQIPGPMLKVKQGSSVYVNFTNNIDMDTAVHWHGLRLENKYDGVPGVTQTAVKPGESFLYKLDFPDEGIYWYHPHLREDKQQEMGLYGSIFVEPKDKNYFNPVDDEIFLFLDDIRMVNDDLDKFGKDGAEFALMGRFGNVMLVNGETNYQVTVRGETARFYLTDSSNTRTFNFSIGDHKMKLVGGDSGKYERESLVDSITISPGERYIVEVMFSEPGEYKLLHKTPTKTYELGTVKVTGSAPTPQEFSDFFTPLKENTDIISSIDPFRKHFDAKPDYELDLTVKMLSDEDSGMEGMDMNGMNMEETTGENAAKPIEPIEWEEGEGKQMNSESTSENTKWIIMDKLTGKESPNYKVKVGDVKKIRIFNDPSSAHPMQHPIHLHGARFLVLNVDGTPNDNLVWKDVVLVPTGSTVDILVQFTEPGEWVAHCHIAEHLEAGMMFSFTVNPSSLISPDTTLLSPLKQFKSGVAADDVVCKEGLQLLVKNVGGSPACVKPTSVSRLIAQGWAMGMKLH
ncbi:MAG: multicopper oxidase family protein [Candidatus Nitrosotenuis sp.]